VAVELDLVAGEGGPREPNPRLRIRVNGLVTRVGDDELADFPGWKEPDAVLELTRLGVATRPGYPHEPLGRPDRVLFFEIEPLPVSSTEVRERVARGESIDELVPAAVAALIEDEGLYRR
jgi:nicotinate-nucleotide adenylyltransferase